MSLPPPVAEQGRRGGVKESEANGANPETANLSVSSTAGCFCFSLEGFEREPATAGGGARQARRRERERSERSESRNSKFEC